MEEKTKIKELVFQWNTNNKLFCNTFADLRLQNSEKFKLGDVYQLKVKTNMGTIDVCTAQVIEKIPTSLFDLSPLVVLSTGQGWEETKKVLNDHWSQHKTEDGNLFLDFIIWQRISPKKVIVKTFDVIN